MRLTVYYDGQFWVGVIEEEDGGRLRAVRRVFGPEPSDEEIMGFVNGEMLELIGGVTQVVKADLISMHRPNPKRAAREAAHAMEQTGVSTKAQQALQLQREQTKKERTIRSREEREAREELQYQMKRLKAKEKHRGH